MIKYTRKLGKMYAFLAVILILIFIYFLFDLTSPLGKNISGSKIPVENFEDVSSKSGSLKKPWAYSNVVAPVSVTPPIISPPPVRNEGENPLSYKVPGKIPSAPYEQIARNDPRPYINPKDIRTNLPRIKEVAERLRGFLSFQAQLISDSSDPNIQLPLTQARSDLDKLNASINVYERNPGIQPTETEQLMNEIEDNLWYLQNRVYEIQKLSPNQGTPAPLKPSIFEGFESSNILPQTPLPPQGLPLYNRPTNYQNVSTVSNMSPEDASQPIKKLRDPPATLNDLKKFQNRVEQESIRLSSSGSTDPILTARLNRLDRIRNDVRDVINKVENKQMSDAEIPITKKEIENSLKQIDNGIIPQLISINMSNNLPATAANVALENRLPNVPTQNIAMEMLANPLMKRVLDNTTVSVDINYNDSIGDIIDTVLPGQFSKKEEGFLDYSLPPIPGDTLPPPRTLFVGDVPEIKFDPNFTQSYVDPENRPYKFKQMTELNGKTIKITKNKTDTTCRQECNETTGCLAYSKRFGNNSPSQSQKCKLLATVTDISIDPYSESGITSAASVKEGFIGKFNEQAPFDPKVPRLRPEEARLLSGLVSRSTAGNFDWRERARHIGDQIRKRGLNTQSFGVHEPGLKISKNYSWKGYAKMLCSRLEATMETGTAQACGCPPLDWNGWS